MGNLCSHYRDVGSLCLSFCTLPCPWMTSPCWAGRALRQYNIHSFLWAKICAKHFIESLHLIITTIIITANTGRACQTLRQALCCFGTLHHLLWVPSQVPLHRGHRSLPITTAINRQSLVIPTPSQASGFSLSVTRPQISPKESHS